MAITTIAMISQRINSPTRVPDIFSSFWSRRLPRADRLEFTNLSGERALDRKTLHRRSAVEAVTFARVFHDEIGIIRLGDGTAVGQNQDVRIDAERRCRPGIYLFRTVFEPGRGVRTDRAAGGQAEVANDDVGARDRHCGSLALAEYIGRRQHVLVMRLGDHVDLQRIGHSGFLEIGAEYSVDQSDGRKILHAGKAERLQLIEETVHVAERVGAVDAGQYRRPGDDGEHFAGHFQHDRVGVAVRHQSGKRAASSHAVAAGIVDDDQVNAACFLAFGRQSGAGAAADDRLALGGHVAKLLQDGRTFKFRHGHLATFRRVPGRPTRGRSALTMADANSGSLMWRLTRTSWRLLVWRTLRSSAVNSAASASGSQNGWPDASSAETPPSGRKKRTGPSIRLSLSPIQRPMRSFSSGVVRINVT